MSKTIIEIHESDLLLMYKKYLAGKISACLYDKYAYYNDESIKQYEKYMKKYKAELERLHGISWCDIKWNIIASNTSKRKFFITKFFGYFK